MSNLFTDLIELNPHIKSLDEQKIVNQNGAVVGWNFYFFDQCGYPIAGGTAVEKETAKRIAVAECFERALFNRLINSADMEKKLFLDQSPTTSGFAAGFQKESTAFRSICEAVERWAWSKWIDDHYLLRKISVPNNLNPLAVHLTSSFEELFFYQVHLPRLKVEHLNFDLVFSVFLGRSKNGVFAGSRVTSPIDDPWEHAIIEACRNLNNFKLKTETMLNSASVITKRVFYFGEHFDEAIRQIVCATKETWPEPKVKIHTAVDTGVDGVFLFRSLCSEYLHWHLGNETRFVY